MHETVAGMARNSRTDSVGQAVRRLDIVYSALLFATAVAALSFAASRMEMLPGGHGAGAVLFFIVYGLFTIAMGYVHPRVGYVSFDRIAQVAGILVLGPVAAAWINGVASLVFPWHRLRQGQPFISVLTASLHNAGLMSLMILVCGLLYQRLGGPLPLEILNLHSGAVLLLLLLSMQALNDIGMRVFMTIRDRRIPRELSIFAFLVESGAGLGGILVAIAFNRMEAPLVALLLAVMSLGMLTLTELAQMRTKLEAIVEERTRKLSEKTRELERIATHDPLTGLYNRRFADEYLDERIEEFNRYQRTFAVALVDLDHFKSINDLYSHNTGDEVLRAVSAILSDRCRETDMVARYGGEEFLLCFPEASIAAAEEICEQIRHAIHNTSWDLVVPGAEVTLSAGVAAMRPGLGRRDLLGTADRNLYAAKAAGRNRVVA